MTRFKMARLGDNNTFNGDLNVNGKLKSENDLTVTSSANSTSKTLAVYLSGATRGGVYEVTVVYNFNPAGSGLYTSIWHGIISLPTGYDATNSVHTALKCVTLASYASTNFASYTPVCQFSDNGSTIKKVTETWYGNIALTFGSHVVFSGSTVPTLIGAKVRKII